MPWTSSCCSVTKLCPTLCDPIDCSTPDSSVFHYLPEFAQIHVCIVKAMGFPVVMYRYKSGTIVKKLSVEELMLLKCGVGEDSWRISWTAKRSNQSILKEINPECSLEGLMLKLKPQYFGHLMWSQLFGKDPDTGKDWRQKEKRAAENEMVR